VHCIVTRRRRRTAPAGPLLLAVDLLPPALLQLGGLVHDARAHCLPRLLLHHQHGNNRKTKKKKKKKNNGEGRKDSRLGYSRAVFFFDLLFFLFCLFL
jgi:hypothetical protein